MRVFEGRSAGRLAVRATENIKYVDIKNGERDVEMNCGHGAKQSLPAFTAIAFQSAIVKVGENGWTPPLIPGALGGIRANTRTGTLPNSPSHFYPLCFPVFLFFSVFLFFNSSCLPLSVCVFVKSMIIFSLSLSCSLSPYIWKSHPFLSLSDILFKTHMTLCQICAPWSRSSIAFFFFLALFPFHYSSRIPSNKQQSTVLHTSLHTHSDSTVCVCGYKCMLIVLLIFSFMLSLLLSCENLSVWASIVCFYLPSLHSDTPPVSYSSASCVWPIAVSLFSLSINHSTLLKPLNIP